MVYYVHFCRTTKLKKKKINKPKCFLSILQSFVTKKYSSDIFNPFMHYKITKCYLLVHKTLVNYF